MINKKDDSQMTKKEAFTLARELRAQGNKVRILKHEGVYTQPGVGMVGYIYYSVEAK